MVTSPYSSLTFSDITLRGFQLSKFGGRDSAFDLHLCLRQEIHQHA